MSFFEITFSGILTPEYEEKTKELLKLVYEGYPPFSIHKFWDESIYDEKKIRTLIIYSNINMSDYFYRYFSDCKLQMRVYYKQLII